MGSEMCIRDSAMSPGMAKCPICDGAAKARSDNPSFPFCSARCKTVDLGKWLNEEYRVPVEGEEPDEDDGGASNGSSDGEPDPGEAMRH